MRQGEHGQRWQKLERIAQTGEGNRKTDPSTVWNQEQLSENRKIILDTETNLWYNPREVKTRRTVPGTGCWQRNGSPGQISIFQISQNRKSEKFLTKPKSYGNMKKSKKQAGTGHRMLTENLASFSFWKYLHFRKSETVVGYPFRLCPDLAELPKIHGIKWQARGKSWPGWP